MKLYKMQIGQTKIDYEIYSNYDLLMSNLDSLEYKSYFLVYDPNILSDVVNKSKYKTSLSAFNLFAVYGQSP